MRANLTEIICTEMQTHCVLTNDELQYVQNQFKSGKQKSEVYDVSIKKSRLIELPNQVRNSSGLVFLEAKRVLVSD